MKGLGTDEDKIINELVNSNNKQRQEIAKYFHNELNRVSI